MLLIKIIIKKHTKKKLKIIYISTTKNNQVKNVVNIFSNVSHTNQMVSFFSSKVSQVEGQRQLKMSAVS